VHRHGRLKRRGTGGVSFRGDPEKEEANVMSSDIQVIECKNCEARYRVPAGMSSQKLTCKRCGKPIFVRNGTTAKRHTTTRRYTRVKGAQKPKAISALMYCSGVGCVLILVGAVVAFVTR